MSSAKCARVSQINEGYAIACGRVTLAVGLAAMSMPSALQLN